MRSERQSERAAWTTFVDGKAPAAGTAYANKACGRRKVGERNRTEAAYEQYLEQRKMVGEILWYEFEAITFRLADDVRYTPDFAVMLASGLLEMHELKGTTSVMLKSGEKVKKPYFQDDARVKVRVAASKFPIVFKVVFRVDGNWIEEEL